MPAPQTEVPITVDGIEQERHVIEPGEYILGRNADCHIRVDADLVPRQHAKLTLTFDNALIEDFGSSNGTFVNDAPVTERTRLWPGQKIRIGAATVTLRRLQGEAPTDMSLAPAQMAIRRMLPAALRAQKRLVEAAPLAALLDPDIAIAKAAILARLREVRKQPGWADRSGGTMERILKCMIHRARAPVCSALET